MCSPLARFSQSRSRAWTYRPYGRLLGLRSDDVSSPRWQGKHAPCSARLSCLAFSQLPFPTSTDLNQFSTCPRTITEWSWHERLTLGEAYVIAGVGTCSLPLKTRLTTDMQLLNPNTVQRFDADRLARCSYFSNITGGSADWSRSRSLLPLNCGRSWQVHLGYPVLVRSIFWDTAEGTNAACASRTRAVPIARV